jgi:hypothetical protein
MVSPVFFGASTSLRLGLDKDSSSFVVSIRLVACVNKGLVNLIKIIRTL